MAFSVLYLMLCFTHLSLMIGCCQGNFTSHHLLVSQPNVSVAEIENRSTITNTEDDDDPHRLTNFSFVLPSRPPALDKLLSLSKLVETADENSNLPEELNDVLAIETNGKDENDNEKSDLLLEADKCRQGVGECPPFITDEPAAENGDHEKTSTVTSTIITRSSSPNSVSSTASQQQSTPSQISTVIFGARMNTSSQRVVPDENVTVPASENIIPVELPESGRKDILPTEIKEPTAPLSQDEKTVVKHIAGHHVEDEEQQQPQDPKTIPTLLPALEEKDFRIDGPENVHHQQASSPESQGHDNHVHSVAASGITKPVDNGQPTPPKDASPPSKDPPPIKINDEHKKEDHEHFEPQPTKFVPELTSQISRTEPTDEATSTISNTSYSTSTASTLPTTIRMTTKASYPTKISTTAAPPTYSEHETKRTSRSTTTTTTQSVPLQPVHMTNKTCSDFPVCVKVRVSGSVCEQESLVIQDSLRAAVVGMLSRHLRDGIHPQRVVVSTECDDDNVIGDDQHHHHHPNHQSTSDSLVFFVTDPMGEYEEDLTSIAGVLLRRMALKSKGRNSAHVQVISAKLIERGVGEDDDVALKGAAAHENITPQPPPPPFVVAHNSGMIAAVAISAVAGACLCLLCLLMVVMKQRLAAQQQQLQNVNGHRPSSGGHQLDAYSLDSFSINASFRRRRPGRSSVGSFTNHGFVADQDDMALLSKRMSSAALAALLKNHKSIVEEEFQKIPMNMPKPREIPPGAEVKNRYVNVVPNPKTRVLLADNTDDPVKTYINANYVRGYDNRPSFYIACQSPLAEYVEDFWKMVWEQQSRVILMLTLLEENGIRRCAPYFPESTLECRQLHGDYQVTLLKKDITEFYTLSVFKLYCIEKNLFREIRHFWFTTWPAVGVPSDPMSLVTYLLQARPFTNCNSGPTIVHCSAGTGRTGTVIALDRCMREYEESRTMDIVQCVAQIRRDRGGAVQNKQQYLLIHEAMMEYASYTANQSNRASIQSSEIENAPTSPQKKS